MTAVDKVNALPDPQAADMARESATALARFLGFLAMALWLMENPGLIYRI